MARDPDDIFGSDDKLPLGRVIDVTPKKEKGKGGGGVDFDSDKPPIEQILEEGNAVERKDKRPETGCFGRVALLVCLAGVLAYFLVSFFLR